VKKWVKLFMRNASILFISVVALLAAADASSASLVSLYYDDSVPEDGLRIGGQLGHGVVFTAPVDNWSLSEISIMGMLAPNATSGTFSIEVWDQNLTLLTRTTERAEAYFGNNLSWARVDLPEVKVSGSFLVCIFEYGGVFVGIDTDAASGRSVLVSRSPNRIVDWNVQNYTQNQTAWMIRSAGWSAEPDLEIEVLSDTASERSPARITIEARDRDGNLNSATLFIMNNKTREIVWSETREMHGKQDRAEVSWPAAAFSISSGGFEEGSIYAGKNGQAAENVSHLLTYYAPCITQIDENLTVSTRAYFGEDGGLNAIVADSIGAALYISQQLMNLTGPKTDYAAFSKNMSVVPGKSQIAFLKMLVPAAADEKSIEVVGPLLISGTAAGRYDITLEKQSAGEGEYVALAKVVDGGYNEAASAGERSIRVDRA